jgi:hypothetical protein
MGKRNKKRHEKKVHCVYSNDVELRKLQKKFAEQKHLYEVAQGMLMRIVIRYIDDKEWVNLKQFCQTYA